MTEKHGSAVSFWMAESMYPIPMDSRRMTALFGLFTTGTVTEAVKLWYPISGKRIFWREN